MIATRRFTMENNHIVLAIDTAMNGCSVCVYDAKSNKALAKNSEIMNRGQAERLMPMIEDTLQQAQTTYSDIDLIAVTKGPGAFTGMRIGIATAKALSLSLNIPAIGVSTFDAVFRTFRNQVPQSPENMICILLETKRKDFYCRFYKPDGSAKDEGESLQAQQIIKTTDDLDIIFVGDAVNRIKEETGLAYLSQFEIELSDPEVVAVSGLADFRLNEENGRLKPFYIRPPDVTMPKQAKRFFSGLS